MTLLTQFLTLLLSMVTFKVAAGVLGKVGFGEYVVLRRAISITAFPLLMGLGISIPRYTAAVSQRRGNPSSVHFLAGWIIAIPTLAFFCLVATNFSSTLAYLVLGNIAYHTLIIYATLPLIGLICTQ